MGGAWIARYIPENLAGKLTQLLKEGCIFKLVSEVTAENRDN